MKKISIIILASLFVAGLTLSARAEMKFEKIKIEKYNKNFTDTTTSHSSINKSGNKVETVQFKNPKVETGSKVVTPKSQFFNSSKINTTTFQKGTKVPLNNVALKNGGGVNNKVQINKINTNTLGLKNLGGSGTPKPQRINSK